MYNYLNLNDTEKLVWMLIIQMHTFKKRVKTVKTLIINM